MAADDAAKPLYLAMVQARVLLWQRMLIDQRQLPYLQVKRIELLHAVITTQMVSFVHW